MNIRDKLECFYLVYQSILMFAGKTEAYQVLHSRVGSWTKLEKFSTDKHSSLLQTFVNYVQKTFITLGPGAYEKIQTLDLGIMGLVFCHCVTRAQPRILVKHHGHNQLFINFLSFSLSLSGNGRIQTLDLTIVSRLFYHCATSGLY